MFVIVFQGNMKQHMLTHKIRDMPQHMFDNNKTASVSSSDESSQVATSLQQRDTSSDGEQHHQQPMSQSVPAHPPQLPSPQHQPIREPIAPMEQKEPQPIKREPTETELPLPKRPPSKLPFPSTQIIRSLYIKSEFR